MRERIAVVTTSYPNGPGDPSGHFVQTEVRALEAGGADVEVFALRGDAFGWPGAATRLREKPWRILGASREMWRTHGAVSHLGSFSRVIAHWAVPSAWPVAASVRNLEIVSHGGDVRLLRGLPALARAYVVGNLLQNTRDWRFPSEALRDDLARALGAQQRASLLTVARVQPPMLEVDVHPRAVERARERQRLLANGASTFVAAARLVPSKRIDLERLAKRTRAHAHFFGVLSRPDTLAHIAAADALVHTSEAEGLSSVVREADALGVRVITS